MGELGWLEVFLIIGQILNTGAVVSLFIFIQRVAFGRIKQLEDTVMECKKESKMEFVRVPNCVLTHKRIDEYLAKGEKTMDDLVKLTSKINSTVQVVIEKISNIEDQSRQRRIGD